MLTVSAYGLLRSSSVSSQINLFDEVDEVNEKKSKKKEETIDKIRQKYGNTSILRGAIISSDIGIYDQDKK